MDGLQWLPAPLEMKMSVYFFSWHPLFMAIQTLSCFKCLERSIHILSNKQLLKCIIVSSIDVKEEVSRERSSKPRQFKNDTHTSIIMSTLQKVTDYKRSQNTNTYLHKCISRQSVVIQGVPYARIISKTSIS